MIHQHRCRNIRMLTRNKVAERSERPLPGLEVSFIIGVEIAHLTGYGADELRGVGRQGWEGEGAFRVLNLCALC